MVSVLMSFVQADADVGATRRTGNVLVLFTSQYAADVWAKDANDLQGLLTAAALEINRLVSQRGRQPSTAHTNAAPKNSANIKLYLRPDAPFRIKLIGRMQYAVPLVTVTSDTKPRQPNGPSPRQANAMPQRQTKPQVPQGSKRRLRCSCQRESPTANYMQPDSQIMSKKAEVGSSRGFYK